LKYGSLKLLELSGSIHACNGTALPLQPNSIVALTKIVAEIVKIKQSRFRPRRAQRVPGS